MRGYPLPRTRQLLPLAVVSALFALSACAPSSDGGEQRVHGVVLVVLDTLRADRASCYGNERETTPSLDALAALSGVQFERALSSAPWTLPSVGALLAGDHPSRVFDQKLAMTRSLVERIQAAGIATAAITEGGYVSRQFGMNRGFDEYYEEEGAVKLLAADEEHADPSLAAAGLERVFERAEAWLEEHGEQPFFLLVHTYEPHTPYSSQRFTGGMPMGRIGPVFTIKHLAGIRSGRITPTPQEIEYVTALYDGDIHEADAKLGELMARLDALGLSERVATIVTSDHGEELGEGYPTGLFDHGHSLRDEMLRVPLVINDPAGDYPRGRVQAQVALLDVMPTVCELLGVELGDSIPGHSLLPLMRAEADEDRVVYSSVTKRGPGRVAVSNGRYKLILVKRPAPEDTEPLLREVAPEQLYDLVQDPGETRNLITEKPELATALREALERWSSKVQAGAGIASPEIEDEQLRERLRSLGYME